LSYLQPGDLEAGNARIDEAAANAGRDPSEIVRLLNVSGRESADQLTDLAVGAGASTFIIGGDDPGLAERFAAETMPAVRAAVAAERARTGTDAHTARRSAKALSLRRPGIAYDDLPASLRESAVEPGDFAYRTAHSTYLRGGKPGLVLRPGTIDEVSDAVRFAARHPDLPLGVRSGGHGISGRSTNDGGLVIDVGALNEIEVVDPSRRLVRIGPGARWGEVAHVLEPHGWAISSGDSGSVGVGGLATAGGIGFLSRSQGLTIDRLRAADVVLADGSRVHVSADENPELFWAIRGAGASIGIVVSFEFAAAPVGEIGHVQLAFDASDTAGFLRGFADAMAASPRDVTLFAVLAPGRGGQPPIAHVYGVVDSDDPDTIIARLQPFAQVAPLVGQQVTLTTYASAVAHTPGAEYGGQGEPHFRSGLIGDLDEAAAAALAELITSGASPWLQLRAVGGAVADVPTADTAYAHRGATFAVTAVGASARFDALWNDLSTHFEGMYLSFETRTGADIVAQAFPPETLARLREIKRRVDPTARFGDNFPVDPQPTIA
ncbi:FAD-binding oxidoreductase, partial [Microbacterium sp.]|uniref:FAD-binding oxidoreductase n=1 Tax=Microbacterium sp. TaxID=51671 RepID=UPI003A8476F5